MRTLALLCLVSVSLYAEEINTVDAASHVGQSATVCGQVSGVHTAERLKGTPTFLDLDGRYPHQQFTVLIWGDDRAKFGDLNRLAQGQVCVSGRIGSYHGGAEIILHDAASLVKK